MIHILGNVVNTFISNKEAAEYFQLTSSTISNKIRNKTKTQNNTFLIKNEKIKI